MLQRIKPWHALAAMFLVGVAIALFLYVRNSGSGHTDRFSDSVRHDFYYSGMVTCMVAARENPAMIELGASEAVMHGYCDCAMSQTAENLTTEEIQFIDEHHDFPQSAYAKLTPIVAACWQTFLID